MAAQRIELCRCLQSELPDFLRALTLSLPTYDPFISVSYITFVAHIGKGTWTDRQTEPANERLAGLIWQRNPDGEMRRETEEGKEKKERQGKSLDFEN